MSSEISSKIAPEHAPTVAAAMHQPAAPLDHAAVRTIVAGIMLAMFLSALEQTIVAPALPAIGKSLGGIDNLSWVVTGVSAWPSRRRRRCSANYRTFTAGAPF